MATALRRANMAERALAPTVEDLTPPRGGTPVVKMDGAGEEEEEVLIDGPSEAELYERFAKLSEKHAAGDIDDESFEEKRAELFELLGLEPH